MGKPIAVTSKFDPHATVQVDPYDVNPLLQDAAQASPATVKAAWASNGPPPRMFGGGLSHLPPFTASGIDPQVLSQLPYTVRHAAAAEPDAGKVLALLEQHAGSNGDAMDAPAAPGLSDYQGRFSDWLAGKWTNPAATPDPEKAAAAEDELYDSLYGEADAAIAAKNAAVAASSPPLPRTAADRRAAADQIGRAQR